MDKARLTLLNEFEQTIGYKYHNIETLNLAFTHSSFSNESLGKTDNNERLEFLGDNVVNLIVTEFLYKKLPNLPEGELTKIRATIVCENTFARAAKLLNISKYLLLGRGEEHSGGRERESLLADAFEAFCASVYLDAGLEKIREILSQKFKLILERDIREHRLFSDYKTALQERFQKKFKGKVKYNLVKEMGPDHNKTFIVEVLADGKFLGKASGKSKKEAEHNAAKIALIKLGFINE